MISKTFTTTSSPEMFECPAMTGNIPNGFVARFHHIVDLYDMESTMSLKKAHRLLPSALQPKNIEKTSVRLATSVFCESTRDALQFYAGNEGKDESIGSSLFIGLIVKLWNVLNVKSSVKDRHKRNITKDPVRLETRVSPRMRCILATLGAVSDSRLNSGNFFGATSHLPRTRRLNLLPVGSTRSELRPPWSPSVGCY